MFALLFLLVLDSKAENSTFNVCESGWLESTHVGMGCLQFNNISKMSWLEAVTHCQDKDANLVEVFDDYQLDFLRTQLDMLDDHESAKKTWWTGGNDIGHEGDWMWIGSFESVGDFLWYSSQPNGGTSQNCIYLSPNYYYLAGDGSCTSTLNPICQKFL